MKSNMKSNMKLKSKLKPQRAYVNCASSYVHYADLHVIINQLCG